MSVCETNCKLYKKLKGLVVITDRDRCSKDCYFIHPQFAFCKLFSEAAPYMNRCESCREIFENNE